MTALTVEDRALAAFLGFAAGDALGATVEFMTKGEIAAEYGVHRDIVGGGWLVSDWMQPRANMKPRAEFTVSAPAQ
jgi:ADP-ribosylglycohydrolase